MNITHLDGAFIKVFSQSSEVCLACSVSSLVLVSHGGVLVGSSGIWRSQEPHCQVCRSPCRWPSSTMDLHLCRPLWHWRIHEASPGPPPGIDQEPIGGKGRGQRKGKRGRKKKEIVSDMSWRGTSLHLLLYCRVFVFTIEYLWQQISSKYRTVLLLYEQSTSENTVMHIDSFWVYWDMYDRKYVDTWILHPCVIVESYISRTMSMNRLLQ